MAKLSNKTMRLAITELGSALGPGQEIELHLLGGAAMILTDLIPDVWTTSDLDVISPRPPGAIEEILTKADAVAEKLHMERGWLSLDSGLFASALPEDWETRRVAIGKFGRLQLYALGRIDLIVSKFFAHRDKDLEHLAQMNLERHELEFVQNHLMTLSDKLPDEAGRIDMALQIVRSWHEND